MVDIYVLRLVRGKYYVGMTTRNLDRIWDHIEGQGAVWTKQYPPVVGKELFEYRPNLNKSDEDRITLEMMERFGINNVRGGKWCRVKMPSSHYQEIEKKLKIVKKNNTRPKKIFNCGRCGRPGHNRTYCKSRTTVDGVRITTKDWEYRPLQKRKNISFKKPRKDSVLGAETGKIST
ncbi:MAG: hypothetical protein ACJZ4T_06025 [Candidatus Thalassarchaeaceae archaeon]